MFAKILFALAILLLPDLIEGHPILVKETPSSANLWTNYTDEEFNAALIKRLYSIRQNTYMSSPVDGEIFLFMMRLKTTKFTLRQLKLADYGSSLGLIKALCAQGNNQFVERKELFDIWAPPLSYTELLSTVQLEKGGLANHFVWEVGMTKPTQLKEMVIYLSLNKSERHVREIFYISGSFFPVKWKTALVEESHRSHLGYMHRMFDSKGVSFVVGDVYTCFVRKTARWSILQLVNLRHYTQDRQYDIYDNQKGCPKGLVGMSFPDERGNWQIYLQTADENFGATITVNLAKEGDTHQDVLWRAYKEMRTMSRVRNSFTMTSPMGTGLRYFLVREEVEIFRGVLFEMLAKYPLIAPEIGNPQIVSNIDFMFKLGPWRFYESPNYSAMGVERENYINVGSKDFLEACELSFWGKEPQATLSQFGINE